MRVPVSMASLRFLAHLWPMTVIFLAVQLTMRLIGNTDSIGLPIWVSVIDLVLFLLCFGMAGLWAHAPLAGVHRLKVPMDDQAKRLIEMHVADLPWRVLRAFGVAGIVYASYLVILMALASAGGEGKLTPRMVISLVLCFYYAAAVLAPAFGMVASIAYSTRLRKRLTALGLFVSNLNDAWPAQGLTGSAQRPWLIYTVISLLPTSLLAFFVFLALGATEDVERSFIFAQALVLFVAVLLTGIGLIWMLSGTLKLVVGELRRGLERIRQGVFEGNVPVLLDDDMGELARGLNTALAGLREREDLKDSLRIAAEIQQGLLPSEPPEVPGYRFKGMQKSCYSVGGDYYDYIVLPDGRIWLVIADVAGKGYPAALTVANLQAMLHVLAALNIPFEEAMAYTNATLCKTLRGGRFVTLFMAKLQPETHSMLWLNAGHIPPLLLHEGEVLALEATLPPLGLSENALRHAEVESLSLAAGDTLLAYTDGLTEAGDSGRRFNERKLREWFSRHAREPLDALPERLLEALKREGMDSFNDDLTLLLMRRGEK